MIEETGVTRYGLPLIRRSYDSMTDYLEDARKGYPEYKKVDEYDFLDFFDSHRERRFSEKFEGCRSWEEIETLCRDGWTEPLEETLDLVERAVRLVERDMEQFEPLHAVTGADVDVAAAIAGLPEDMIDYPLTMVSNIGTTITVCCDVQCHAGVSAESIIQRGKVIVALALALDGCGHQTELWVSDEYEALSTHVILRTLVKGPNDYIDPARIMYAYAHPSVQRGLGFCTVAGLPRPWNAISRTNYGNVTPITKDFPEGTLYIEPMFRYDDSPNLAVELRVLLQQLGLIGEE